jgi:hypothetical protein
VEFPLVREQEAVWDKAMAVDSSLHCTEDALDTAYNSEPGWLRRVKGQQPGRVVANCKTANSAAEVGSWVPAKGEDNFLPPNSFPA